ncbi:acyltransferase [soil metagenome]
MTESASTLSGRYPGDARDGRAKASQTKLLSLEFGRFVAALLVVCFHFAFGFFNLRQDGQFLWLFRAGHAGVDYFFVLSGFIIYHVHRADLGRPERLRGFAIKRFIRLYPMYWLIFLTMILLVLVSGSLGAHYDLSPGPRVLDGLLLPFDGDPLLGQSWTLRNEIVFYAVFAAAILNVRLGIILFLLWQCLSLASVSMGPLSGYAKPFLSIFNVGFAAGMAVAWLSDRITLPRPGWIALLGIAGILVCMTVEAWIGHDIPAEFLPLGEATSPLLYIGFASLTVLGMTGWERSGTLPFPALLSLLGGCSYVLYLVHGILISILIRLFAITPLDAIPHALAFLLMIAISIAAAIAMHLYIEKPVMARLRARLLPRSN